MASLAEARLALRRAGSAAVLTGAGVSAASGIPTFRGRDGLWGRFRAEDLATPEAYRRDPELVWSWYAWRLEQVWTAAPNPAHVLLAAWERRLAGLTLVTQNVDGLHQRAGSRRVLELHGSILRCRCEGCGQRDDLQPGVPLPPRCSRCGDRARPDVVWYGELLDRQVLAAAAEAFAGAEVALVIGTSALVEPAAGLGRLAASERAFLIEINPRRTPLSAVADAYVDTEAVEGLEFLLGDLESDPG